MGMEYCSTLALSWSPALCVIAGFRVDLKELLELLYVADRIMYRPTGESCRSVPMILQKFSGLSDMTRSVDACSLIAGAPVPTNAARAYEEPLQGLYIPIYNDAV